MDLPRIQCQAIGSGKACGHYSTRSLFAATGGQDLRHKKICEKERPHVARSELTFQTILGFGVFACHDAGVVHEYVDVWDVGPAVDGGGCFSNLCQGFEIQL